MGMNTKPSRLTGFAAVCAHAVPAGIMASSNGNASAAPPLFSNVRRGIAFFVRNIAGPFLNLFAACYLAGCTILLQFNAPHLKRSALHDPENQRRETVPIFR